MTIDDADEVSLNAASIAPAPVSIARRQSMKEAPAGHVLVRALPDDPDQVGFLYVPRRCPADAPIVVSVHGITRNACEHAMLLAPFAERYGAVLVAPMFSNDRFRRYQRLRNERQYGRPDRVLEKIIADARHLTDVATEQIHVYGYSGGGQFAHRYTMAHPEKVAAVVVGAAGWYTFPDPRLKYPYGIAEPLERLETCLDPARFLKVPACVLVGEKDIERDAKLNQSSRIDRQQGRTRMERGKRWIAAMSAAARVHDCNTIYRFYALPNADHSFSRSVKRSWMATHLFEFLFTTSNGHRSDKLSGLAAEIPRHTEVPHANQSGG